MSWQREDAAYAAAALAAATLVIYFTIGNFGLVPSPLAPGRAEAEHAIGVPSLSTLTPAGASPAVATAAVPQFPSTPAPGGAGAGETARPAASDRTRPGGAITTAGGTQLTLTEPATVDGTATDAGSGVRSVDVTFTPASGGAPTVVPAKLACNDARTRCTWSADVPGLAGDYRVTAAATDRASNVSQSAPVEITVVNGGSAVNPVADVVDGLVDGLEAVLGGL